MKYCRIIIVIILSVFTFTKKGISQLSVYNDRNVRYLDSVEDIVRPVCTDSLVYPDGHKINKIKVDLQLIEAVNEFFEKNFEVKEINNGFLKIKSAKVRLDTILNGLIKVTHVVANGVNIHLDLTLESIDNLVFRKVMLLNLSSYGRCGKRGDRVLDFKYLREIVASRLNHLIKIVDYDHVVASDFLQDNLIKASEVHNDYKFNVVLSGNEPLVDRIFNNQFIRDSSCCYNYLKAPKDFISLIKNGEVNVIKDLLYSPNYFYSVNAMEAIIYLEHEKKILLNDSIKERIQFLKMNESNITIQKSYDLFSTVDGYNELNITDEQVVKKYRNSLN